MKLVRVSSNSSVSIQACIPRFCGLPALSAFSAALPTAAILARYPHCVLRGVLVPIAAMRTLSTLIANNQRPSLLNAVLRVVRTGAKEQMRRVYAWRVIAAVANLKSARMAMVQLVRNAVRQANLTIVKNHAVSIRHSVASPFPASARSFLHLRHEALNRRAWFDCHNLNSNRITVPVCV
jgi:hypothetical protein